MTIFLTHADFVSTYPRRAIVSPLVKHVCQIAALDRCQPAPNEFVRVKQARASRVVARPRPMTPLIRESGVKKATANAGGVPLLSPPVRAISIDQSLSVCTNSGAAGQQPGSVLHA